MCEATCGLELHLEGKDITLVRGDRDDVFSHGFLCPKGTALKQLESDPDRLRRPQVRRGDSWHEVSWDDAFAEVERGLTPIFERYGRDAGAMYMGNPNVHNLAGTLYSRVLIQAVGSKNLYSAGTVDQMPKQVSAGLMFGMALSMPIPDIDRTDYLLILGANPFASNGSLMTAPDYPGRLRALRARGGKFVVVDPRRSKTAEEADEHLFIRPGTDAQFLFGVVHTLFEEELVSLGTVADHVAGVEGVELLAGEFSPEAVAPVCGWPTLSPAISTAPAARCSRSPRPGAPTRLAPRASGAARVSVVIAAGCAAFPRCSASCRSCASPRRLRHRARVRCGA